jgi:signal transduction histidine kinase
MKNSKKIISISDKTINILKNQFFNKLLFKPLMIIILISLWPILTYLIPSILVPYLTLFSYIQVYLFIFFVFRVVTYFKYIPFPTYEEANQYFTDLKSVQRAEKVNQQRAKVKAKQYRLIQREKKKKEDKEIEEKQNQLRLKRLKDELEERKKKVL